MSALRSHVVGIGRSEAAAEIRRELARELHDSVVQTLQLMLVEMEQFKRQRFNARRVVHEVDGYQAYTREALNELREMLYELRDESLFDTTLAEGLGALVASFQAHTGIRSQLTIGAGWPGEVRRAAAHNIRRVVEEGLNNVRRHSRARDCDVLLGEQGTQNLHVLIRDNGVGFTRDADRFGLGLTGIRERVVLLGGRLELQPATGGGTILSAVFPRENIS